MVYLEDICNLTDELRDRITFAFATHRTGDLFVFDHRQEKLYEFWRIRMGNRLQNLNEINFYINS